MLGVLARENADRVVIIGTGYFTKEAQAWANGQPIELVDGPTLLKRLKGVDTASIPSDADEEVFPEKRVPEKEDCPQCGGELVLRTAKRGTNAGNQFMGCSAYPKCRFTKAL